MTELKYIKGIVDAEDALSLLNDRINCKEYKGSNYLWGGADVVIGASPPPESKGWWSNNDISIVTPYCKDLSWLFIELRDIFYETPLIDYLNKYEFFGRLADSASKYMESVDDGIGNREVLLLAVHNEAEIILKEMLSTIPHIEN